jgi:hypothetical protein
MRVEPQQRNAHPTEDHGGSMNLPTSVAERINEVAIFFARRYEKPKLQVDMQTDMANRCRFCNAKLEVGKAFCNNCGRAQL